MEIGSAAEDAIITELLLGKWSFKQAIRGID